MAVLSRSSLRGSVRRNPDDHSDNDRQGPLKKKQRTLHDLWPLNRRISSPDCLDTTAPDEDSAPSKARHALPPLKPARPPTATRRTRRPSSSSVDSVTSGNPLTSGTPRVNGNGVVKNPRGLSDRATPAGSRVSAADVLRGDRESPDPLDTISPVVTNPTVKTRSRAPTHTADSESKLAKSPTSTRTSRRSDPEARTDEADTVEPENKVATTVQSAHLRPADATRSQQHKSDEAEGEQEAPKRAGSERRSLRSTDPGPRGKLELAQYFHNYEQIISLDDPKPELVAFNTIVTLVDDLPEPLSISSTPNPMPFGNPLQNLYNCEVITLPEPASSSLGIDPLNEELYFRAHRKFERQEKQLRNIERERAQHEKQHVDRLLEELRGPDWLRVMGLTGVHENEKKLYEPKRQILIDELVALIKKFQVWRDEERKRKLAKEKQLSTADTETESHAPRHSRKRSRPAEDAAEESSPLPDTPSTPDPNDVDAWAARQLHQEARSASAAQRRKSVSEHRKPKAARAGGDDHSALASETKANFKRQKPTNTSASPAAPAPAAAPFSYPPPTDKPFTSFFEQPHDRETALAAVNGTRRGRTHTILAFGHPMPDMQERDFDPPEEILTDEAIHASQRQRRMMKRRSRG
ncbi:uncharacterized protein N7482_008931 [Penicillium canariense]|uniref:Something about silencing protein 4 domain-containing protein n=1 Tax=Penicillium canariense TaxID=189055 RepID=A0A9W9HUP2_9EURO|nr:uncharacterized protein N7482_008931 [Penicillium canariense]KAJ5157831.1 hypothetical protein N7482_008931 [Penicillium canariense]